MKNKLLVRLKDAGQSREVTRLIKVKNQELVNLNVDVRHCARHTNSAITIIVIAADQAEVNINALVRIEKEAFNSSAIFKIRTLLVSGSPKITVEPKMEVLNETSKAEHGVATINLNPKALFYAATRGLNATRTRQLLIKSLTKAAKM